MKTVGLNEPRHDLFWTLSVLLSDAAKIAEQGPAAIADTDDRNLAVGTILPLQETLTTATSVVQTIITLHRLARYGGGQ